MMWSRSSSLASSTVLKKMDHIPSSVSSKPM